MKFLPLKRMALLLERMVLPFERIVLFVLNYAALLFVQVKNREKHPQFVHLPVFFYFAIGYITNIKLAAFKSVG